MRDIIWTIIIIWVLWRVLDLFKGLTQAKASQTNVNQNQNYRNDTTSSDNHQDSPKKGHLKPDAGEYVDFEETK
jgi:hypothetical protein